MSYDLAIEEQPSFLHARVSGTHNAENVHRFLVDVHEAWVQRKCSAVLLEMKLCGPSLGVLGIFNIISERAPYAYGLKQIAYVLHISPRTAEAHKYEMMETLHTDTTADLIQYAVRSGVAPRFPLQHPEAEPTVSSAGPSAGPPAP